MIEPDNDAPLLAVACALDGGFGQIVTASGGARQVTRAELRRHLVSLLTRIEADRPVGNKILLPTPKPNPTLQ